MLQRLLRALLQWWGKYTPTEIEYIPPIPMKTNKEKFLEICQEALDTEVTPQDKTPDNVACSETMSTLIQKLFPDFPILPLTTDLFYKLKADKRFMATLTPKRGCIVISPKVGNMFGHVGYFVTDERIANNNSKNGLWQATYSWDSWIREFRDKRGLKIYLFEVND